MNTISDGTTTITPVVVHGFSPRRENRNVLIEPIDSPEPYVSHAPAASRSGSLTYVFAAEADAIACDNLHTNSPILTLTVEDPASASMAYVLAGTLGAPTRSPAGEWTVTVEFREVSP